MNYKEIESLKLALLSLSRKGCSIKIPSAGLNGKIIGVGFKPYWTGPMDSIIEKLEINYIDENGRVKTYHMNAITGYEVLSNDGRGYDSMKRASIDFRVYSADKGSERSKDETIKVDLYIDETN